MTQQPRFVVDAGKDCEPMKQIIYRSVSLSLMVLSLAISHGARAQGRAAPKQSKPASHVSKLGAVEVAGVSVSGLTRQEARRRLMRELSKRLDYMYVLTDGHRTLRRKRRHLGVHLDINGMIRRAAAGQKWVPLMIQVQRASLQKALRRVAPHFDSTGRDAFVKEINRKGDVKILPGWPGRRTDVPASTWTILSRLEQNPGLRYLHLKIKQIPVKVTPKDLQGINGRLGRYTTRFNPGNVKRTKNLRLGIYTIDGTVLKPGQVFSLNEAVGPRTQQRGFRTATIFENGYKVPGIGAGVSQVTGTLFNAALVSGLPIVTYRTHSRPVSYLPLGRDATVAWGDFDMKFKNDTEAPIYISYRIAGNRAVATLYGKKMPGQRVNLYVQSQRKGPREVTAQLYRTIRRNGKVVKKEKVGSSHYKWNEGNWEE
jgi:vancomycin resistance protein YoaR